MEVSINNEKHITSVDYLRVVATFLITNSHFAKLYPRGFGMLSFGGMFGDCLFFFVSGYCLANRTDDGFFLFIKRRVLRVYIPYLVCVLLLLPSGCFEEWTFFDYLWPIHTYTFLPCILTLYPLFYLCIKWAEKYDKALEIVLFSSVVVELIYFFTLFNFRDNSLSLTADYSVIQVVSFFIAMLLGTISKRNDYYIIQNHKYRQLLLAGSIIFFVLFVVQSMIRLGGGVSNITLVFGFWFCVLFRQFCYRHGRTTY